jgi:hypothetical protein
MVHEIQHMASKCNQEDGEPHSSALDMPKVKNRVFAVVSKLENLFQCAKRVIAREMW